MGANFNDAPIGSPAMKNDAQHFSHDTLRNKDAIKHMGDFSNHPKPPKPQLRNEDAIKHMGDPSKPGPSADESKKGVRRARARKAKAKPARASIRKTAASKRTSKTLAADTRVSATGQPAAAPAAMAADTKI